MVKINIVEELKRINRLNIGYVNKWIWHQGI